MIIELFTCSRPKPSSLDTTVSLRSNSRIFNGIPLTRFRIILSNTIPVPIGNCIQRATLLAVVIVRIISRLAGSAYAAASSVWRREPGICIIFLFDQINPGISRYFIVFDFINLMRCRIKIYK